MTALPITTVTAALAALMLFLLSFPVTLRRMEVKTPTGFGDDPALMRRIRAQGNFVEYVPVGLILVGLAESAGGYGGPLFVAVALGVGRVLHALGMLMIKLPLRIAGMILTYTALLVGAGLLIRAVF